MTKVVEMLESRRARNLAAQPRSEPYGTFFPGDGGLTSVLGYRSVNCFPKLPLDAFEVSGRVPQECRNRNARTEMLGQTKDPLKPLH